MKINDVLVEFAPSGDSGGSGDYFQALASAWYNGTFDTGSLQKGIKSQQDVEQLLQRGIIGPDGVTRKYGIDYNSTFDGVVISSDDYYEHADHDETDSRTGKPFGPYDYMEFGDEELDEGLTEVDRRGFLKGVGAAAVAGAAGTGIGYEIGKKEKTSKLQMPSNPQAYFLLGYVYNMISGLILNSNTEMSKWSNEMFDLHSQAKVEVASSDNNNLEMSYHKGTKAARDTINEIKGWNNYPIDPTGKAAGLTQDQAWEYDRKFRNDTEIARQIENKTRPYYDKLMKMVRQNNSVQQGVAEGLTEFAADDGNDGGEDDALRNYARMWWGGDEATQMQIERALARMGWEIGEDEGGYDNGGVFVVRAGDVNGNSYQSWAAEDLTEGVAEGILDKARNAVGWLQDLRGQVPARSDMLNNRGTLTKSSAPPEQKSGEFSNQFIEYLKNEFAGNADNGTKIAHQISFWSENPKDYKNNKIATWTDRANVFQMLIDTMDYVDSKYPGKDIDSPKMSNIVYTLLGYKLWSATKKDPEQGVAEATGDEKFDTMMGQIQREPKYPDSQMPPTDVKDLYQWAVKNNKPYHKIFAEWANREGFKSVAPALQRAGDLDTEALDYWTPRVWKIYWGEVRGIDSEMPPEWSKKRVPDELRDYLETVFDAYDRIVFDWPTEYRQIGGQDNYAEGARKPEPPEADYGADYQDMVSRVKKLAGLGPLKTVYDPQKRVYKNMPTAVQPKKEQR